MFKVRLVYFLICWISIQANAQLHFHNRIDNIKSARDVEQLILSINPEDSNIHVLDSISYIDPECKHLSDSMGVKAWTKADFDGNGLTDILIIGKWDESHVVMCIMDSGQNRFVIHSLAAGTFQDCTFPIVRNIGIKKAIINTARKDGFIYAEKSHHQLKVDTLVFEYDCFVELNKKPIQHNIQRIEYSTLGCFGPCPIFRLVIDSNRTAKYNEDGEYIAKIDENNYNQLTGILNYISFDKMDTFYSVPWSDDETGTLEIIYDDGKRKKIEDYGMRGTFGLRRLHALIWALRKNKSWTPKR